jgi:Holliday junction resolvase RusA-like endonuclease
MDKITITVPGEPVGKGRPRMTRTGHAYTPAKTRAYERQVKQCFQEQIISKTSDFHPTQKQLCVTLLAFFTIPKSKPKATRRKMATGETRPTKKPDLDNVVKMLDALNGLAFYDDAQIVTIKAEKFYSTEPRLEITIEEI